MLKSLWKQSPLFRDLAANTAFNQLQLSEWELNTQHKHFINFAPPSATMPLTTADAAIIVCTTAPAPRTAPAEPKVTLQQKYYFAFMAVKP